MAERIEQKITIGKNGFNAFMLNEMMDIIAMQKAIMETLSEIRAEQTGKSKEAMLQEINARRLAHFTAIMEKVLSEYGSIPDGDNIAN